MLCGSRGRSWAAHLNHVTPEQSIANYRVRYLGRTPPRHAYLGEYERAPVIRGESTQGNAGACPVKWLQLLALRCGA